MFVPYNKINDVAPLNKINGCEIGEMHAVLTDASMNYNKNRPELILKRI